MKKIYILFFILYSCFLFGQHPDLVSQRWYVKNVTINGVTTVIPQDRIEFPFTKLNFDDIGDNYVNSKNATVEGVCQKGLIATVSYTSNTIFSFNTFMSLPGSTCNNTSIQDFMTLYINFFNDEVSENFTYTITNILGKKTLIITSNSGNQVECTSKIFEDDFTISDINWFLVDLIIDGVYQDIPVSEEIPVIPLLFNNNPDPNYPGVTFTTMICNWINGFHFIDEVNSKFYIYEIIDSVASCIDESNEPIDNAYIEFFNDEISSSFTYNLEPTNDAENNLTLTITNFLGDQAIYSTGFLSTEDYVNSLVSLYPNPIKDYLIIKENSIEQIKNISIYNTFGKKVVSTQNKKIELLNLDSGLYFVLIKFENGKIAIKKIIKS